MLNVIPRSCKKGEKLCFCLFWLAGEVSWLAFIGEYSARKIHFFPGQRKNCEKISPYISL